MNNMNNEAWRDHGRCFSWHNNNFKILDYLAVILPNFIFPLISTKELKTLFSSSQEWYFKCTALKIAIFFSVLKEKT